MPELPEIHVFARDMRKELAGRTIGDIEVLQPKCLNLPEDEFRAGLLGAQVRDVTAHGKWLQAETTQGWLLLNLGMGGEILLTHRDRLPEKYRLILDWEDGGCLAINFWWSYLQSTKSSRPTYIGRGLPSAPLQQQVSLVHPTPQ